jgi:hypothetical protein
MPVTKPATKLNPDELLRHLHDGLAVLGLGELRRALDENIAEPVKDDSRLAWLWRLVEPQVRRRLESRAERRIREARLPVRKTFEAFNNVKRWIMWRSRAPGRRKHGPQATGST